MGNSRGTRTSFGNVTQLRSGRWQARWKRGNKAYTAKYDDGRPLTFPNKPNDRNPNDPGKATGARAARRWLDDHRTAIEAGEWPPKRPEVTEPETTRTFETAAHEWMARRDLSPRTEDHYRQLLRDHLFPTFGRRPVGDITRADIDDWWHLSKIGDTAKRHAYSLMRSVFAREADLDRVPVNPCRLDKRDLGRKTPGAKKHATKVLDDRAQLDALAAAMPERHRLLVELATLCALRFGEVTELRRSDIDLDGGVLHVRRAVARVGGQQPHVKTPKSDAGTRTLPIPTTLVDRLRDHLDTYAEPGLSGLLFPAKNGGWLAPSAFYGRAPVTATKRRKAKPGSGFYGARAAIGRPDLHFHDLRHTGLTWLGHSGATPQVLALYAGHSGLGMVARYSVHETPGLLKAAQDAMLAS